MKKRYLALLIFCFNSLPSMASVMDGVSINYDPLWMVSGGVSSSVEGKLTGNMSMEATFSYAPIELDIGDDEHIHFSHHRYGLRLNYYTETATNESLYTTLGMGVRDISPTGLNSINTYDGENSIYYELRAGTLWNIDENIKVKTGLGFIFGKEKTVDYNTNTGILNINTSEIILMDSAFEPDLSISYSF